MKPVRLPTLAALIGACILVTACDRRDSSVPPPMPQTTSPASPAGPSTSGGMGGAMPGGAASTPGTGASN